MEEHRLSPIHEPTESSYDRPSGAVIASPRAGDINVWLNIYTTV